MAIAQHRRLRLDRVDLAGVPSHAERVQALARAIGRAFRVYCPGRVDQVIAELDGVKKSVLSRQGLGTVA